MLVLPEDDANRQLATGFDLNVSSPQYRVEEGAGGWHRVCECFVSDHLIPMQKYTERYMVLLIDFDNDLSRLETVKLQIPDDIADRVFVIGARNNPEALKRAGLGSYETIGSLLADDCRGETEVTWSHDLLRHNEGELTRLRDAVRPFLFPPS